MFDVKTRADSFLSEWAVREAMLKSVQYDKASIQQHRREILHMYQVTEEDVKKRIAELLAEKTGVKK